MSEDKTAPLAKGQGLSASPDCQRCHGTGIVGGHWLGDKWCDHMHTYSFCDCNPQPQEGGEE